MDIPFSKLAPSGNPTIILEDEDLPYAALPDMAARLMHPLHLRAEQVGALYCRTQEQGTGSSAPSSFLPHLRMMGGEFCVNATRAAAFLLARQGRLCAARSAAHPAAPPLSDPLRVWGGRIMVSGANCPVDILVSPDAGALDDALRAFLPEDFSPAENAGNSPAPLPAQAPLWCAARIACDAASILMTPVRPGMCLVSMPGMQHLLVDASLHPLPDVHGEGWRSAAAALRAECGLTDAPASGVIWFQKGGAPDATPGETPDKEQAGKRERGKTPPFAANNGVKLRTDGPMRTPLRIWPAVAVRATGSEHMETACGSASMALALHVSSGGQRGPGTGRSEAVEILQPSGECLRVRLQYAPAGSGQITGAWIAGPVTLVAQGTAYI